MLLPEIATDILSRLPVKSLKRFRCVSKPWCKEIDSLHFINLHLQKSFQSRTHQTLILHDSNLYTIDLDAPNLTSFELKNNTLNENNKNTEVIGSCNGLLALIEYDHRIALYNPSTRQYKTLPITPYQIPCDVDFTKLTSQWHFYGFGHDPINDDYKIVRLIHSYGHSPDGFFLSDVKLYSLKTNSWQKIKDYPYYLRFVMPPDYQPQYVRGYGVFANSSVHWRARENWKENASYLIVAFDFGVEEFRIVPQPEYWDNEHEMNLGVLGGCLCVLCNQQCIQVEMWVMKEYGVKESWVKLCTIISQFQVKPFCSHVRPLAYSNSGDEILLELDNNFLVWYNLRRRKARNVKIRGAPERFTAEICVGSLVSLDCGGAGGQVDRKNEAQETSKTWKKRDEFLSKGFKLVL